MPHFFDKATLTTEQLARWDWAMAEYARVREMNVQREYARMSEQDKLDYLATVQEPGGEKPVDILSHMKELQKSFTSGAGDVKSSLFARLLDGLQALPYPPPTAFSYPWYSVIEEEGPFPVMIGVAHPLLAELSRIIRTNDRMALVIFQCMWSVISMNDAAQEMLALNLELTSAVLNGKTGSAKRLESDHYDWTPEIYAKVVAVYAKKPEFVVQFGEWPAYRLAIGQESVTCSMAYAKAAIAAPERNKSLANAYSVFDISNLWVNATINVPAPTAEHLGVDAESTMGQAIPDSTPSGDVWGKVMRDSWSLYKIGAP